MHQKLVPITLPSGTLQIRTWFGDVRDNFGNAIMSVEKVRPDSIGISGYTDNPLLTLISENNPSIPFNFPIINFTHSDDDTIINTNALTCDSDKNICPVYVNNTSFANIIDVNNNILDICGFYPDITRDYIHEYMLVYYTNLLGIKSSNNYNLLLNIFVNTFYSQDEGLSTFLTKLSGDSSIAKEYDQLSDDNNTSLLLDDIKCLISAVGSNYINTSNFTYLEPNNPDILFVLLETIGNGVIKINANNVNYIKEIEGSRLY